MPPQHFFSPKTSQSSGADRASADRRGYKVFAAEDGARAVRLFEEHQEEIDLVVSDVVLPELSGRDIYHRVRAIQADVPFIFCTGFNPTGAFAEFTRENGLILMEKPFDSDVLLANIQQLLEQASV